MPVREMSNSVRESAAMTPNTPEDVSEERLAELILWLDRKWNRHHEEEDFEAANALRQFQRHRAENNELDAKRYRWLRGQSPDAAITIECSNTDYSTFWHLSGDDCDRAIDSAMSNASKERT